MKELQKYLLMLLLLFLGGLLFFYYLRSLQIDEIKSQAISESRKQLFASMSAFDKLSQNFYNDYNDYISRILYHAENGDAKERRLWRTELLNRLYAPYRSAVLFGLNQFQIQDRKGYSFLRFHYYDHYGDDLKSVRPSLQKALKEKRFLKGFEVGRYVDGLRYIYPLFYDGEFVGSYEWVWNHEALIRELRRIYGGKYALLVERSSMNTLVVPEKLQRQYARFPACSDYLYQKNAFHLYGADFDSFMKNLLETPSLCRKMKHHRDYAYVIKIGEKDYLVTNIHLQTITGASYGYFLSIHREKRMAGIDRLFLMEVLLLLIVLLLIYLILHRSYREKMFVRTLLDSQKDLVILTNGEQLSDANRAFLEFFNVESIEEFVRQYDCICNLFIEAEGYVGKRQNGRSWLEYMYNSERENRVIIFDRKRGEERVFMVSLNRFDDTGLFVIAFRDITELEREKRHFKIESMMDHLTQFYNKRTFEHFLKDKLEEIRDLQRNDVAIIMYDIDYFKRVNDRYGHQKGDEVLRKLAELVSSGVRKTDFLVRWGGEEFVIVMENTTLEAACHKAEELRQRIEEAEFGLAWKLTCSFGVTMLHSGDTTSEAVERVDQVLYRSKESGRNRVICDDQK